MEVRGVCEISDETVFYSIEVKPRWLGTGETGGQGGESRSVRLQWCGECLNE